MNNPTLINHLNTFMSALFSIDPSQRPCFSQLASHPFLTFNSNDSDTDTDGDGAGASQTLEPLRFHLQPAVVLPRGTKRSSREDKDWGRRQFSHIWAPMPQDFTFDNSRECEVKVSTHSDARVGAVLRLVGPLCSTSTLVSTKGGCGNSQAVTEMMSESEVERNKYFE